MDDPILRTERLDLRPLRPAHGAFIVELLNDPLWLRFIGNRGNVRDAEGALRYVERTQAMYARYGHGLWLVERREDGVPLGLTGLIRREQLRDVDLGFGFLSRYQGLGYGHESARAALDFGVRELGLARIVAITSPENAVSCALLEKLGFRHERTYDFTPGDPVRLYAVGAEESADARA